MFTIMAVLMTLVPPSSQMDEVRRIEREALSQRLAVKSWEVEIHSQTTILDGKPFDHSMEQTFVLFSDGLGQERMDETTLLNGIQSRTVNSHSKKGHIHYIDKDHNKGVKPPIAIVPSKEYNKLYDKKEFAPHKTWDPRILGMIPEGISNLRNYHLEDFVGANNREAFSLDTVEYNGTKCYLIKYKFKGGASAAEWISPDQGYGVVRVESRLGGEVATVRSIDNTLEKNALSGLWYPKTSIFRIATGGRVHHEEMIEVRKASFNQPIDQKVFTLNSISPEPGRAVSIIPGDPSQQREWDGKQIVLSQATPKHVRPSPRQSNTLLFAINGLVFIALGIFILTRKFRKN